MIYAADEFFDLGERSYDVCIIGSGPSGICLGLELLYAGLTVCTVAGGDLKEDDDFRRLKEVECPELEIRNDSRIRAFGGTSATWSGYVAPLDPIDLAHQSGIHSGWPSETDVTSVINERGYRYDLPRLPLFDIGGLQLEGWPNLAQLAAKVFLTQRPPVSFGRKFKYAFTRNEFDLVLGAAVTGLASQKNGDGRVVNSAILRSLTGRTGHITARAYVLAAGCIENVRLLWTSTDEAGVALGNRHDLLGRGFMNHPKGYVGEVYFNRPLKLTHPLFKLERGHFTGYVGLRLKETLQQTQGLLNSYLRLEPQVQTVLANGLRVLQEPKEWIQALTRPFRVMGARDTVNSARVRCFMNMEASMQNRITLSERFDSLGVPIPVVRYSASERALESLKSLVDYFSTEIAALGIGRFVPYGASLRQCLSWDASHHLGGTPIGKDPQTSVVSPNLRLHDVENLYVAGGSVFPTGGSVNPTLTMIGLSLRLADTVRATLSSPKTQARRFRATSNGIIIVGAGRRVAEDVVPAIEALAGSAHIQSIYATRPGVVFGRQRAWDVAPILQLGDEEIAAARAIYIAVPPVSVPMVLSVLRARDCSHISLIVDTPAVSSTSMRADYCRFRNVNVAEDSVALPWLSAVYACSNGAAGVRRIHFKNSAYRYHAFALAKAIVKFGQGRCITSAYSVGRRTRLRLATGPLVVLIEPRDYATGQINICLGDGRVISSHADADITIACVRKDDRCTGFSVAGNWAALSDVESELAGRFTATDNVVTRMLELKRVGLYRLLSSIISREPSYPLTHGVEDAMVDRTLARQGFYVPLSASSPNSAYHCTSV
jgi:choline dehydrogenase-like flavoprotein